MKEVGLPLLCIDVPVYLGSLKIVVNASHEFKPAGDGMQCMLFIRGRGRGIRHQETKDTGKGRFRIQDLVFYLFSDTS